MRKTTEELAEEAGIDLRDGTLGSMDELEDFRRLVIENERECAEPFGFIAVDAEGDIEFNKTDRFSYGRSGGTPLFTFPPAAQVTEGWKDVAVELPKDGQLIVGCNKDYGTWTEVWDSEESVGATRWWIAAPERV